MGIAYVVHYTCRARREALLAKAPFARATQRTLKEAPLVFRSGQAGPPGESFDLRAKIVFVLRLKQLFPEDLFVREAPVSVEFFDRWFLVEPSSDEFSLEDVVSRLTPDMFANPLCDAPARELAAMWLNSAQDRAPKSIK